MVEMIRATPIDLKIPKTTIFSIPEIIMSITVISLANLVIILPIGLESKKSTGARATLEIIFS